MKKVLKVIGIIGIIIVLLGIAVVVLLKNTLFKQYPEIVDNPQISKWYRITPKDAKSSDGSEWHGLLRLGKENKVMVFFYGGGVSLNEETSKNTPDWYFFPTTASQDFIVSNGIFSYDEKNPFKDWTFIALEYSTGDFHTGQGEVIVKDDDGKERTVNHNGYNNYSLFMNEAKKYIDFDNIDSLVITGSSAGGFATALLSDDVIGYFKNTKNITSCVDSALLYYDGWKETANNIWHSPKEISDRLVSNNIVLDNLKSLQGKHPDVKILFTSSIRDKDLQRYQAYIDYGSLEENKSNSDKYQKGLKQMVDDMNKELNSPGFYIFECGVNQETTSTQHMIMPSNVYDRFDNNKSVAEWLMDSVNGNIESYGLDLLDKNY